MAQFEAASGSELAAFLREALAEVDQLDERLCALMTLHRQEPVKPRTFDLEHLLERVARALASRCEAQAVRLSWQIDAGLRFVEADLSILEEALLELGQNALRASPHGGTLHFSARWTGAHSEIRVEDAGTGVAPSIRHRIFEPFFTTHPGGSGIGLASMRLRLEQAGASLALESSSAAGSCFLLCLPRLDG